MRCLTIDVQDTTAAMAEHQDVVIAVALPPNVNPAPTAYARGTPFPAHSRVRNDGPKQRREC